MVEARPRDIVRPHFIISSSAKQSVHKKKFPGKMFTGRKNIADGGGIVFNEVTISPHAKVASIYLPIPADKGKGVIISHPVIDGESSDDEFEDVVTFAIPPSMLSGSKVGVVEHDAPVPTTFTSSQPLLYLSVNEEEIIAPIPLTVLYPNELISADYLPATDGSIDENDELFDNELVHYDLVDDTYILEDRVHEEIMKGYISRQEC